MTTETKTLTYDHIVALALEHGFKLKPQADGRMALNDYVIDFARAVYDIGRAAAKAETAAPVVGRWYFVTNDGAATLCVDEADARESAAEADIAFPRMAPHRAVQLVPADQLAAAVAAVAANSSEHAHAMAVLRPIADMPRRTREQRLASACVRFLDAIRAGAKEPSDG